MALAVLVPLIPVSAHAESSEDRSPIIVTAHTATEDARENIQTTPGGVDIIDSSSFGEKVAVSLRDTLSFSPGVYAQPRFGQEVRLSIRGSGISRGFHMRGLTLLQDGIPINLADDNGDFQELDPQVFQRIEVYRGSNALRYGGSTLGGAVNAVTPTGRTAPGFELRIDGGSFDTFRSKAAAGFATARGDGYIALTTDSSDGDRDHAKRHAVRFNGNAGIRLADAIETRVYVSFNHINQRLPGALTRSQALADPSLSLPSNIAGDQQRDIDSVRLQNKTTVDLGNGSLAFGAFYNAKKLFHPIFQVVDQKSDDRGVFANLDLAGSIAGASVEMTLGSSARFGTVRARQYRNVGGHRGAQMADARQKANTIDSYGELRIKPAPALSLIAGGVHVHGNRQVDNYRNPAASGDVTYDRFAPKFGVLWQARGKIQVYANYSRSVELPGFIELTQSQTLPGFVNLDPQRAWTAEVGTRGSIGIARWDVSIYRATVHGELLQFLVNPADPSIPASTFNARRTRHQGIEAGLDLHLSSWARLRQVYQYNDFRFRGDARYGDNRLPVIPKHQYRAELRLGSDTLSISPNVEWVPQGAWADYANTTHAPGYTMLGLSGSATIRDGLTIFVDARNLTNKKAIGDIWAVTAIPSPLEPGSDPAIYYPVERRAFYAGLRATF